MGTMTCPRPGCGALIVRVDTTSLLDGIFSGAHVAMATCAVGHSPYVAIRGEEKPTVDTTGWTLCSRCAEPIDPVREPDTRFHDLCMPAKRLAKRRRANQLCATCKAPTGDVRRIYCSPCRAQKRREQSREWEKARRAERASPYKEARA